MNYKFKATPNFAKELKTLMQEIGKMLGVKIKAVISSMETPLRILCWE